MAADAALETLKKYFGHTAFRGGQRQLVEALLAGRDVLGVMPTGAGKSVCYQVPALLREGLTLVISPLISLMQDQVAALKLAGVPAAYLNSSLTAAQRQEVLRRYYKSFCDCRQGLADKQVPGNIEFIMQQLGIKADDRLVVHPARQKAEASGAPSTAIQLHDGRIVTGRMSELMTAPASALINAVKLLAGMADKLHLLSPLVLEPILHTKRDILHSSPARMSVSEILIAMSICAATNPMVELAMSKLTDLSGCDAHSTVMLSDGDANALRKLGLNFTCDPEFYSNEFYTE